MAVYKFNVKENIDQLEPLLGSWTESETPEWPQFDEKKILDMTTKDKLETLFYI